MNQKDIGVLFQGLNIWKRGGQRAPHKPLLLLYALGKCAAGSDRWISYRDVDEKLRILLIDFGPPRKSIHPEYPFWRLQNDSLWELSNTQNLTPRKSNTDAKKSELLKYDVHGGFPKDIYIMLSKNPKLVQNLATQLLDAHFPSSMHEDILNEVGLEYSYLVKRKSRDPEFRAKVLQAYEYRCAVCGLDIRLGNVTLGLDAAHIKWYQAGGPDREDNGLALCVLHHRMFDQGAFTLSENLQLLVSQSVSGSIGVQEWLIGFHNSEIREPQSQAYFPNTKYITWHQKEVFRKPARE